MGILVVLHANGSVVLDSHSYTTGSVSYRIGRDDNTDLLSNEDAGGKVVTLRNQEDELIL